MKHNKLKSQIILLISCLIFFIKPSYSQNPNEVINSLISSDNLFELKEQHSKLKGDIIPLLDYLSESILASGFNRPKDGINALTTLLNDKTCREQLGFQNIINLTIMQAMLYEQVCDYNSASAVLKSLLKNTSDDKLGQSKAMLKNLLENELRLASQAPQRLARPSVDSELTYHLEATGRGQTMFVPAKINGKKLKMIFDTGCPTYNFISERIAKELGVTKVVDSIAIKGVGEGTAWIGSADSLCVSDITYYNPLFYVVKETATDSLYKDAAVLGANLFNALGEVVFYPQEKKIVFPVKYTPLPASGQNLVMKNRQPYIKLNQGEKPILMHFDTGNVRTYMTQHYYLNNIETIKRDGQKDSLRLGGYGGITNEASYKLPLVRFELSGQEFIINDLDVSTVKAIDAWHEDGCFGTDFIQQLNKLTLSYKDMFIEIKN